MCSVTVTVMERAFSGKQALVVGGTGGIGRAVALGLAERGAVVTITGGSSQERLEATLAKLEALNDAGKPESAPVTHSGFLCQIGGPGGLTPEKAAAFILEKASTPDILVLAWGPFKRFLLQETPPEDWRYLIENNLIFPGIMISLAICDMINKGWGRILLFGGSNTAEIRGFSTTTAYGTAKTALGVLAKSTARTAGKKGIPCNVVCPGLTDTEYVSAEDRAYNQKKGPGGKALVPEEIARFVLEVLENPVINGAIIPIDGGLWI